MLLYLQELKKTIPLIPKPKMIVNIFDPLEVIFKFFPPKKYFWNKYEAIHACCLKQSVFDNTKFCIMVVNSSTDILECTEKNFLKVHDFSFLS